MALNDGWTFFAAAPAYYPELREFVTARYRLAARRGIRGVLRPFKRATDRAYWLLNRADAPSVDDPAALDRLADFYRPSVEELTEIMGCAPPWPRFERAGEIAPRPRDTD